jgi:hypothetical protein
MPSDGFHCRASVSSISYLRAKLKPARMANIRTNFFMALLLSNKKLS